jgi:hypothetical protein
MSKKAGLAIKERPKHVGSSVKAAVKAAVADHHKHGFPVYIMKDDILWQVNPDGSEKPLKRA